MTAGLLLRKILPGGYGGCSEMTGRNLVTDAQNTWCPGCGNFTIQHALKNILAGMEKEGKSLDNVVLVAGIGCHAKIADYLNINTFYSLHGRAIPVATGIKLANPDLTVICCCGTVTAMPRDWTTSSLPQSGTSTSRSLSTTTVSMASRPGSIPRPPRSGIKANPPRSGLQSIPSTRSN